MSQPQPQPQPSTIEIICTECGADIRVHDPAELIRALHLKNECILSPLLSGAQE